MKDSWTTSHAGEEDKKVVNLLQLNSLTMQWWPQIIISFQHTASDLQQLSLSKLIGRCVQISCLGFVSFAWLYNRFFMIYGLCIEFFPERWVYQVLIRLEPLLVWENPKIKDHITPSADITPNAESMRDCWCVSDGAWSLRRVGRMHPLLSVLVGTVSRSVAFKMCPRASLFTPHAISYS